MNCHKDVPSGSETGTSEISKIYDYIGYNPETNAYDKPQKPIGWNRIHNLPDHVYFNHAQHANVAELECQTCHGPVEEMDVLYQAEPLSMGWCISCHRDTDVKFEENAYYGDYEKLHRDLKAGKIDAVKVADIGGTECQRCHY